LTVEYKSLSDSGAYSDWWIALSSHCPFLKAARPNSDFLEVPMPTGDVRKVLFLSTGDSSRSQIAEGFLRAFVRNRLIPVSAGIDSPQPSPLAIEAMSEAGIDISIQQSREIRTLFSDMFRYVVTICDSTKERFPVFPFAPNLLRWSVPDPVVVSGGDEIRRRAFRRVRDHIRNQVDELIVSVSEPDRVFAQAHAVGM
jgi:arsenate reductase